MTTMRELGIMIEQGYARANPKRHTTIVVYVGGEMVGQINRRLADDGTVSVNGKRVRVIDPGGHCRIELTEQPHDLDTRGY